MAKAPAFFVSHGSPTLPFENVAARDFLRGLGAKFEKPKAILIASAHWETDEPLASTAKQPETIHDFYGFPPELYKLAYPAPGAPEIAARAAQTLRDAGFADADTDPGRGLDHGAWVPLSQIYDDADVPVFQLSIQPDRDPAHHHKLGQALAKLRDDGIAIVGSGSATHNLRALAWNRHNAVADWAKAFDDWFAEKIAANDIDALLDYRARAPNAAMAHPTDEHLLPIYVAMGAGGQGERLHHSFTHGSLSMAAYSFA